MPRCSYHSCPEQADGWWRLTTSAAATMWIPVESIDIEPRALCHWHGQLAGEQQWASREPAFAVRDRAAD
ncbi:MAG: hypothetical protein M3N95_02975 [Actinomycetota bacterium]|nr:hypothetical protein [Actinomycetota bacterium]